MASRFQRKLRNPTLPRRRHGSRRQADRLWSCPSDAVQSTFRNGRPQLGCPSPPRTIERRSRYHQRPRRDPGDEFLLAPSFWLNVGDQLEARAFRLDEVERGADADVVEIDENIDVAVIVQTAVDGRSEHQRLAAVSSTILGKFFAQDI